MTLGGLVAPLIVATVVAMTATSVHSRLPPRLAARLVTTALVVVTVAAVPTVMLVALAFLAHVPLLGGAGFRWCAEVVGLHGAVSAWVGAPAVALLVAGGWRSAQLVRQHRDLRVDHPARLRLAVSDRPFAVTLPGAGGQIVISTALLGMLDEREHAVVVAHERAHAGYRHDRYLLVAELAAAALPPLRAMAKRLAYSVERWADEAAAARCGDRRLVAATLGKVALHRHPPTVAGIAGLGVAGRMTALLRPAVRPPRRGAVVVLWAAVAVSAVFSAYQLHHLEQLVAALCAH
jgi:Zn-dependent protease with chaperone function